MAGEEIIISSSNALVQWLELSSSSGILQTLGQLHLPSLRYGATFGFSRYLSEKVFFFALHFLIWSSRLYL